MQEFLTNNTVSCNLMSLTGYRTLVILSALMESPKSNDEINECLYNDQYIREKFSGDTLRIYINNLRAIGCEITRANKSNKQKYTLISHPFSYNIEKSHLQAIAKLYKGIYSKLNFEDVINIENFFSMLSSKVEDQQTKNFISSFSMLKSVDKELIKELLIHCKKRNDIVILYNSPKSGLKEIEIKADKLSFKSEKLYLWGDNLTHHQYSYFAVDRIKKISCIRHVKSDEIISHTSVIYELYGNKNYTLAEYENIIKQDSDKLTIKADVKNEFSFTQKILSFGAECKILSPENYKSDLVAKLNEMEKIYEKI